MKFWTLLLISTALLSMGTTNCAQNQVKIDLEMSASAAQDETLLIEGCGQQLASGLTLCRKQEGDPSSEDLYIIAPPVKCLGNGPCVSFKIFFPDGSSPYGDSFLPGTTREVVNWKSLLKRDTFELSDRGLWPISMDVKFLGTDGQEHHTYADGEIVLRVYHKGYVSLSNSSSDPNFVWEWIENTVAVKMTTGMRAWVAKK